MGKPELHVHHPASDGGFEADAVDFELLDIALADTLDHVVDDGATEAVEGLGRRIIAVAGDEDFGSLHLGDDALGEVEAQLALGALDPNRAVLALNLDLGRQIDGKFSNAGHGVSPGFTRRSRGPRHRHWPCGPRCWS